MSFLQQATEDMEVLREIEGTLSDLASVAENRPKGYPFSKVLIKTKKANIFRDALEINSEDVKWIISEPDKVSATLNFKLAGKILKSAIPQAKAAVARGSFQRTLQGWSIDGIHNNLPLECITISDRFPVISEISRQTCKSGKAIVEVSRSDASDLWLVIQFRRAVKAYLTEILGLNLLAEVFREKTTFYDNTETRPAVTPRVFINLVDCSEELYQALEVYGRSQFQERSPLILKLPERSAILANKANYQRDLHVISFERVPDHCNAITSPEMVSALTQLRW